MSGTPEWLHVRCGKVHEAYAPCPRGIDPAGDATVVAAARLAAVVEVRDRLKREVEFGLRPDVRLVLSSLTEALGRTAVPSMTTEDHDVTPDPQGYATVRHTLDTESVTARAWTADGARCEVAVCVPFGLGEVEILTAPEARRVRLTAHTA